MANEQNLTPFPPGTSGNPNGKKSGTLNLSTLVKKLATDEKLADKMFKQKPEWWNSIEDKHMASAIVGAMMMRAASGDSKAAAWFRKSGWGEKLDLTSGDQSIQPLMVLDMNPPKPTKRKAAKRVSTKGNKPQAKRSLRTSPKPKNTKA